MPIDALTERLDKGSSLTAQEGDTNWETIAAFVNALEDRLNVLTASDGTFKAGLVVRGTASGSSNPNPTYAVTVDGTFAALTAFAGKIIIIRPDLTNVGAANLTLNGFTANIFLQSGQEIDSGNMVAGYDYILITNGTDFFLVNPHRTRGNSFATTTNGGTVNDHLINNPTGQFEIPEALYAGYKITFKAGMTSSLSAAVRLKVSQASPSIDLGFTAILIGAQNVQPNMIISGGIYTVVYDGSNFQLQTPGQIIYRSTGVAIPTADGRLAAALTHGLGGVPDEVCWTLVCNGGASVAHGYSNGDSVDICSVYATDSPLFIPFRTATQLDVTFNYPITLKITKRDGSGDVTITGAQLSADFTLSVAARRYVQ